MSLLLVGLFGNLIKTNWPQGALQNILLLQYFFHKTVLFKLAQIQSQLSSITLPGYTHFGWMQIEKGPCIWVKPPYSVEFGAKFWSHMLLWATRFGCMCYGGQQVLVLSATVGKIFW